VFRPFQSIGHGETWASYSQKYKRSIEDPTGFWGEEAMKTLSWIQPFTSVVSGTFDAGDINWFANGKLNVSYNCIDRHIERGLGDKIAIIWEGDEPDKCRKITFTELRQMTCKIANVLKARGVRKGDAVTIYMPMIPELAITMLACARIGAVHSVVFAGFSAESLRGRILDCGSRFVVTADQGLRGGKRIALKTIVDDALAPLTTMAAVLVFQYTCAAIDMRQGRDYWMHDLMPNERPYCPCEVMDSEDPLFMLYTSGSTGKPKGVSHTSAGYLLNAAVTIRNSFDLHPDDVYCCAADCGWITGHTYIVYGPLCNGTTTVMFESLPTYPNPYRYWDMVQKHRINVFYTAPTAIRTLMRFDPAPIANYDLSTLRILGSVGEPINPEAWRWYFTHVGRGTCSISDTYWQTETGSHLATSLPGTFVFVSVYDSWFLCKFMCFYSER
jgi:acetyl-CoA synthetase